MKRSKTTYRDLLGKILDVEFDSKAGKANIVGSVLVLIFIGMVIVPTVFDIGRQIIFAFLDKPSEGLSPSVVTTIILGGFMYILACPTVLIYIFGREEK